MSRRSLLIASLLLALIGLASSVYLTHLHVCVHTDPACSPACNVSEKLSCSDVAMSPYAIFLNVPVAVWAILAYAGFFFMIVWGLLGGRRWHWPVGLYWLLSLLAVGATGAFAYIAEAMIGALCIGCMVLYVVNPLLFAAASILLRRERGALRRDFTALGTSRPLHAAAVVALISSAALLLAYPRYWVVPQGECDGLPTGIAGDGSCWIGRAPGAGEKVLEIVEFSDYRCPFCRRAHWQLRDLVIKHKDRVRLVHKHFPLDTACHPGMQRQLHQDACLMARMAYCASRQGKFWDMNDRLFEQSPETSPNPAQIARDVGIDPDAFVACLDTPAAIAHVRGDIEEGMRLRIEGTPSFLIDGKIHTGQIPEEVLRKYLDGSL